MTLKTLQTLIEGRLFVTYLGQKESNENSLDMTNSVVEIQKTDGLVLLQMDCDESVSFLGTSAAGTVLTDAVSSEASASAGLGLIQTH